MDEEHDSSYKQFDQTPRYQARVLCEKLSELWQCPLVLSDATPSMESYYSAEQGKIGYLPLHKRPSQQMPTVEIADMKNETQAGNFSIFSRVLIYKMEETLKKEQQVILFLNRRGTATSLVCRDCGTVVACFRCDVPLPFHASAAKLICHHCGRYYPVPSVCGKCGSHKLKFLGTGTEKVESEIARVFPGKRIRRLDSDTVANPRDLQGLYKDFVGGNFDILVGTQLVARGWDLSQVGLIGVINADSMLALPDFRSSERTFQLITQVAGRSGRGSFPGHVVMQTYSPENLAIKAAASHNYKMFFETEIKNRREYGYPPFTRIVKITLFNTDQNKALKAAESAIMKIKDSFPDGINSEIIGPVAAFIPREKNQYYYHVIIKIRQNSGSVGLPREFLEALRLFPPYVMVDIDPDSLL